MYLVPLQTSRLFLSKQENELLDKRVFPRISPLQGKYIVPLDLKAHLREARLEEALQLLGPKAHVEASGPNEAPLLPPDLWSELRQLIDPQSDVGVGHIPHLQGVVV